MSTGEGHRKFKTIFITAGLIIVSLLVAALIMPLFSSQQSASEFAEAINKLGKLRYLVFLLIQIVQIVVAFIPGELIEFAAGVLFGTWMGFLVCSLGILIGQYLVFSIVRRFGKELVERIFNSGKLDRFNFLQNEKKLEYITFLLFFFPGTPKDLLTYVFPLTKINKWRFLIVAAIARIPSVITSTYAGATLSQGDFVRTIEIYIIIGALSLIGLVLNNKLMKTKDKT